MVKQLRTTLKTNMVDGSFSMIYSILIKILGIKTKHAERAESNGNTSHYTMEK